MFKRILVALDGSPTSNRGLKAAVELAVDQRATLLALHVIDKMVITPSFDGGYVPAVYIDTLVEALRESGRNTLAKAETFARSCGVAFKPVLLEAPSETVAHAILDQARKLRADVIVLGTHGGRGFRRVLMGSDAEAVVREARVPVLLVRSPEPAKRKPRPRPVKPATTTGRKLARRMRLQPPLH